MNNVSALRRRAAENSRAAGIAGPDRLPQNGASQEGRLRGPFRDRELPHDPQARRTAPALP